MKKLFALVMALSICSFINSPALCESGYPAFGITLGHDAAGLNVTAQGDSGALVELSPDSFLRMVSKAHPITKEAANDVSGMVKITKKPYQNSKYGAQYVHPDALKALEALISDAKATGFTKTQIVETYRSYEIQQKRFNESVARRIREGLSKDDAFAAAHLVTALPGESEHHLGVTVDILQKGNSMGPSFAKTKFAKWLAQNAAQYGFIIRYPEGKEALTGISYEPWHIRFVGLALASELASSGECLEEFYARLNAGSQIMSSRGGEYAFIPVKSGQGARVSESLLSAAYFSETGEGWRVLIVKLPKQPR